MLLLAACGVVPYGAGRHVPPAPVVAEEASPSTSVLADIERILGTVDEVDRRDRLVELRDLVLGAERLEPAARARVIRYASRVVAIEARALPSATSEPVMEMAGDLGAVIEAPIEEETLDDEPPLPDVQPGVQPTAPAPSSPTAAPTAPAGAAP